MPALDGSEAIADEEILYRKISENSGWYEPGKEQPVAQQAFMPMKHDETGVSLWRAKYKSAEAAATEFGKAGRRYYVVVLDAGVLRRHGIEVAPRPHEGGPGHASIPLLNYADRGTQRVKETARLIATRLSARVEGPFTCEQ